MTVPIDFRVSWAGVFAGAFKIGRSKIGGTDVFSSVYSADFGGTYDDLSGLVNDAQWQRGRSNFSTGILAGRGTVSVRDENGLYNPANPSSALAGLLVPGRPCYVKYLDSGGTKRGCIRGFLEDEPIHDATSIPATTTFNIVDLFETLGRVFPVIASTGPTNVGAAIGLVLDTIGFTDTRLRILAAGDSIADFSANGTISGLALIGGLLTAEQGTVFVNGDGAFVHLDRSDRYRRDSAATITGTVSALKTGSPGGAIINRQKATATGGVEQTYVDAASVEQFNYRDGSAITSDYFPDDAAAQRAATRIVSRASTPRAQLSTFRLTSPAGNLDQILLREFGDRVTIPPGGAGTTGSSGDFFIEQLSVTFSKPNVLDATWLLSERTLQDQGFVIGRSKIGGTDPIRT